MAALEEISGVDRFEELGGENDFGEPNSFSLSRARRYLDTDGSQRTQCSIYKSPDKNGHPLLQIDFTKEKYEPTRESLGDASRAKDHVFYPLGALAYTAGGNTTSIDFLCREVKGTGSMPYVNVSMYSAVDQIRLGGTGKERMTILNSVARKFAKELGCLSEAHLPETIPSPSA
ncbi:hypothetical protein [Streptomyces sp. NK08204]|uniref:hypothetical protein n=1 Tax=Streptomyces sp. NK08204 TaxID=2873260 RepID=UPI001CED08C6|nr:hypothetical protein [Streptomyces sp. NK08204]